LYGEKISPRAPMSGVATAISRAEKGKVYMEGRVGMTREESYSHAPGGATGGNLAPLSSSISRVPARGFLQLLIGLPPPPSTASACIYLPVEEEEEEELPERMNMIVDTREYTTEHVGVSLP